MVDLALLQSISYMAGALGVCVAGFYYAMVLREQRKNMRITLETRRIGLIESMGSEAMNEEALKRFFELMNYEWTDYADYMRKYGPDSNVEATAKRVAQSNAFNRMGMLLRMGLVNAEELYDLGMLGVVYFWEKFRPIVEEARRRYSGRDYDRDMEYFASEMLKYIQSTDPSFRVPETFFKYIPDK